MTINDDWRAWIAQNLLLGSSVAQLRERMLAQGLAVEAVEQELRLALDSPLLRGAQRATQQLHERVKKRDWVLSIPRALASSERTVARCGPLSGADLRDRFYRQNTPVVITGMLRDWPGLARWNLKALGERFADRQVELQAGRDRDARYEANGAKLRQTLRFGELVSRIMTGGPSNDFYMTANNTARNRDALRELWSELPALEEYLRPHGPEDGFLWIGPAGTLTPLHHDLTNNLLLQVRGRKRVYLIPAGDVDLVYNDLHCYSQVDAAAIDLARFPRMRDARVLQCDIAPGEILFLPVGWWHQVIALDASVSLSFTNFHWDNTLHSTYTTFGAV